MWSVAVRTLIADRGKLFTALVGVVFSIVLVNVQGGLFLGLLQKAGMLVDCGEADVWVGHRRIHNVDFPRDIPRRWVHRVRAVPGVKSAEPYLLGFTEMTLPRGGFETVLIVGVERASRLGRRVELPSTAIGIRFCRTTASWSTCAKRDKLDDPAVGELREVGRTRARVVARTRRHHELPRHALRVHHLRSCAEVPEATGRTGVRTSWCNSNRVPTHARSVRGIKQRLPEVEAFPKNAYSRISVNFWLTRTGLGISFGAATLLGLFVGLVMVAQTLYALVLDRLPEYGTLKAMGATEGQVFVCS